MKFLKISKSIYVSLLFMCVTTTSFAQEIVGIGDFRIGMTIDEFFELPLIKGKSLQDQSSSPFFPEENDLWKISVDNTQVDESARVYSEDIVGFSFNTPLGVPNSPGKDSYHASAKFYKGKLASINVTVDINASSNFEEILTEKYGKPIKNDKYLKRVICQNGYGAKTSHFDGDVFITWGRGKRLSGWLTYTFYDCGKIVASYSVSDYVITTLIDKVNEKGRKAFVAKKVRDKAGASNL